MKTDIDLLEHAACILDGEALGIRQCHNLNPNNPDWKNEPEAKEWHDDMKNTSTRLYELAGRMRNEQKNESNRMTPLEQAKLAISGTRATASLLEDIQFRLGMETACDEIETRMGLTTAQPADNPEGKAEQPKCPLCDGHGTAPVWVKAEQQAQDADDLLQMVDDLVVSWVGGEPPERVAARKRLEDEIRSILAAQGGGK